MDEIPPFLSAIILAGAIAMLVASVWPEISKVIKYVRRKL